jgi:hypothetical protein
MTLSRDLLGHNAEEGREIGKIQGLDHSCLVNYQLGGVLFPECGTTASAERDIYPATKENRTSLPNLQIWRFWDP